MDTNRVNSSKTLTRRQAIKSAVVLLGGTVTAAQLGPLLSSVAVAEPKSLPRFLGQVQFSMIERIVDLIIPETDTPGAVSAGVHNFIDTMLADWASEATRSRWVEGLQEINDIARQSGAESFVACTDAQRFELLKTLDAESFAEVAGQSFFRDLKSLVLFGYYSSEAGASIELNYDRLPGIYESCVPLGEIGRSWST